LISASPTRVPATPCTQHYLMRPDLGRRLAGDAEARLAAHAGSGHDVVVVIADGLSARAVEAHAQPLLEAALPRLKEWRIAPTSRSC